MKKIISLVIFTTLAISGTASAAYNEIDCASDVVFTENTCNQCFDGGKQSQDANLGFLSDMWKNTGTVSQVLLKAEQEDPSMKTLNGAVWTQTPDSKDFWEITDSMKALYNDKEETYTLDAGKSVDWIQSKLGYAYNLTSNTAAEGENIGVLVYPISTHAVSASGSMDDAKVYKECVLFKSAGVSATPTVITPEQPVKQLPKTGPEHILLLLLAMILGFGLLKITQKS